jgi:hypothetical protein
MKRRATIAVTAMPTKMGRLKAQPFDATLFEAGT